MNSPPPITSRANPHRNKSRRTRSRDDPTTPLIRSIGQTTTERRKKEEAEQQVQRLLVVSSRSCWVIYIILALLYAVVIGAVFLARRSDAFVPPLPDMAPGQTAQGRTFFFLWDHMIPRECSSPPIACCNADPLTTVILFALSLCL